MANVEVVVKISPRNSQFVNSLDGKRDVEHRVIRLTRDNLGMVLEEVCEVLGVKNVNACFLHSEDGEYYYRSMYLECFPAGKCFFLQVIEICNTIAEKMLDSDVITVHLKRGGGMYETFEELTLPVFKKLTIKQFKEFAIQNTLRCFGFDTNYHRFWLGTEELANNRKKVATTLTDGCVVKISPATINVADFGSSPTLEPNPWRPDVEEPERLDLPEPDLVSRTSTVALSNTSDDFFTVSFDFENSYISSIETLLMLQAVLPLDFELEKDEVFLTSELVDCIIYKTRLKRTDFYITANGGKLEYYEEVKAHWNIQLVLVEPSVTNVEVIRVSGEESFKQSFDPQNTTIKDIKQAIADDKNISIDDFVLKEVGTGKIMEAYRRLCEFSSNNLNYTIDFCAAGLKGGGLVRKTIQKKPKKTIPECSKETFEGAFTVAQAMKEVEKLSLVGHLEDLSEVHLKELIDFFEHDRSNIQKKLCEIITYSQQFKMIDNAITILESTKEKMLDAMLKAIAEECADSTGSFKVKLLIQKMEVCLGVKQRMAQHQAQLVAQQDAVL